MQPRKAVRSDKDQARPVDGQMEADAGKEGHGAERSEPWPVRSRLMREAERECGREEKIDGEAAQRDPSGQLALDVLGEPRDDPSEDRNEKYRRQYHLEHHHGDKNRPAEGYPHHVPADLSRLGRDEHLRCEPARPRKGAKGEIDEIGPVEAGEPQKRADEQGR